MTIYCTQFLGGARPSSESIMSKVHERKPWQGVDLGSGARSTDNSTRASAHRSRLE